MCEDGEGRESGSLREEGVIITSRGGGNVILKMKLARPWECYR